MTITLNLPDEIGAALGEHPEQATLEALLAQLYREEKIDQMHIDRALGFQSWYESESFMNRHRLNAMTLEEFEADFRGMEERRRAQAA